MSAAPAVTVEEAVVHGHAIRYRASGKRGPVLVLVHGITSSSRTWDPVIAELGRTHQVIAPDMLGHGDSAKPRGDYSLGAYASGLRDLLTMIGHDRVTIVGHSLGGGVAMQFAYQFPERLERLVLVSSGGLGREVSLLLRAATLPGSEVVIPLLGTDVARKVGRIAGRLLTLTRQRTPHDLEEISRGITSLADIPTRQAFVHTARGIIGMGGQRVSARDRLYLAADVPTMIIWGDRDPMMPAKHGVAAHQLMPGSRLELFLGAGHFPHREDPERFVSLLEEFMEQTEPAQLDPETLRERLRAGAAT